VRLARDVASSFPAIFVRRECVADIDALGVELARQLGDSLGLESFAGTVLSKPDADGMERMMRAHKIPLLTVENRPDGGAGEGEAREGPRRDKSGQAAAVAAEVGCVPVSQDAGSL